MEGIWVGKAKNKIRKTHIVLENEKCLGDKTEQGKNRGRVGEVKF